MKTINLNKIEKKSIEVEGVDRSDYPDFCDTYFSRAVWLSGLPLTDEELEAMTDQCGDLLNELAHESIW